MAWGNTSLGQVQPFKLEPVKGRQEQDRPREGATKTHDSGLSLTASLFQSLVYICPLVISNGFPLLVSILTLTRVRAHAASERVRFGSSLGRDLLPAHVSLTWALLMDIQLDY